MPETVLRINSFPSELLSAILTAAYNCYAASVDFGFGHLTRYPILLSSICSYWRQVALETPPLWATVDIKSIEQAQVYFRRSGTSVLRVRLAGTAYCTEDAPLVDPKVPSSAAKHLLLAHASRMRALVVNLTHLGDETTAFMELLACLSEHTLQELGIYKDWRSSRVSEPLADEKLSRVLGQLRFFHLEAFQIHLSDIGCHNLTELFIAYPEGPLSSANIARLLRSNPGLSTITLFGLKSVDLSPDNTEPIRLPELRRFHIDGYAERIIPWLLDVLVPGSHGISLHLDSISPLYNQPRDLFNSLVRFFQKASIISLHLEIAELPIPLMLQSLPDLQRLQLTSYSLDYPDIFYMMDQAAEKVAKLRYIDLYKCEFKDQRVSQGLQRLLNIPSLEEIRIFRCGRDNPGDGSKLQKLLADNTAARVTEYPGLEVQMRPYLFQ
ncbi:F-box-like protein [Ceratobasidium sp. AG-Ba]|nr:F-box-like protein [Ceratobasidium sp. AG-Ba]